MFAFVTYATPSTFESTRERQMLGLAASANRPVRLHGSVRAESRFALRVALQALGSVIWSDDTWLSSGDILDPVITVHPDRVFFEAFSQDQSTYGMLIASRSLFDCEGDVTCGTTNVDFTAWLHGALSEMRSSRETWFRIGPEGFEVRTTGSGGRFERKVDIPDDWVLGFLRVQESMAMPGTRFRMRPVDLLAVTRYLRYSKSNASPRALRYVFDPGEAPKIVIEPWEHVVECKGSEHSYAQSRSIRTWGRRRLKLLEPLLPYAQHVDVYLKGRAMPSFYAVQISPELTFVLGLTGWTENKFSGHSGADTLLAGGQSDAPEVYARALDFVSREYCASADAVAQHLGVPRDVAVRAMSHLCRLGRVMYDVQSRQYRHRELFDKSIDPARFFPPDRRIEEAWKMIEAGQVVVRESVPQEMRKQRSYKNPQTGERMLREIIFRDWVMRGSAGPIDAVEVVINSDGRLIFGTCQCEWFREHILNQGPCEHMLALRYVGEQDLREGASSVAVAGEEAEPSRYPGTAEDEGPEDDEAALDDAEEEEE